MSYEMVHSNHYYSWCFIRMQVDFSSILMDMVFISSFFLSLEVYNSMKKPYNHASYLTDCVTEKKYK